MAWNLDEDDYFNLIFELIRRIPSSPESPSLMKRVMNCAREQKYQDSGASSAKVCEQQSTVGSGALAVRKEGTGGSCEAVTQVSLAILKSNSTKLTIELYVLYSYYPLFIYI